MSTIENGPDRLNRKAEAALLVVSIVLITLLHYSTMSERNGNILLHEISQRLYYIPIIYSAYRYGLKGSLAISALSGLLYILHISEHKGEQATAVLNQYAEVFMFQIIAIATGIFAQAEREQRERFEKASADLSKAYKELKDTVNLLMRAARLKSLGEMAATIAHEIRNPLSSIKGAIEIIESEIPEKNPKREFVNIIELEIDRLNRLVNDFLKFSKPHLPEKVEIDILELIESVVTFISPQALKRGIKITKSFETGLPAIFIDKEQIKQVFINLILNAIQSMPDGGKIEITGRALKNFIEIEIRDYGIGIEPEKRDQIFDPFFTTKNDGSGLGLSIAYQLVKQHEGDIQLRKTDGQGSLFVICLPI
jgi:two-component system, NtrC family, sensor histidine kinase HydH